MQAKNIEVVNYKNEAESDIAKLGISLRCLERAIEEGFRAFSREGEDSPRTAGGYNAWSYILKQLRFDLRTSKWGDNHHSNGVDEIRSLSREVSIVVSTGDKNTGILSETPRPKNQKGTALQARIETNNLLFERNDVTTPEPVDPYQTWMLLFYIDEEKKEVRYELSLPNIHERKIIVGWSKRIICEPFDISSEPKVKRKLDIDQSSETEEIDFEIVRKNG